MESSSRKTRVLVVEDEIVVSEDLRQRLISLGFDVVGTADTAAEALTVAAATLPDVALMDIMLHGQPEGISAAEHLRSKLDIPVIYVTAHSDSATLQKAKVTDPAGYIVKPFEDAQLRVAIEIAPLRHEMEHKARRVANWMTATLTSIGDAVIATNIHAQILLLNPAAEALTGWSQEEATGKPSSEVLRLFNRKTQQPLHDPAARALRDGIVVHLEPDTILLTREGDMRLVDDSAAPIVDEAGRVMGAVVVLVDATNRVAVHSHVQELAQQLARLPSEKHDSGEISEELEAFAAAVSHDLRGPLRAAFSFSELLIERHHTNLRASERQLLDIIRSSTANMLHMLEDYSRILKLNHRKPSEFGKVEDK